MLNLPKPLLRLSEPRGLSRYIIFQNTFHPSKITLNGIYARQGNRFSRDEKPGLNLTDWFARRIHATPPALLSTIPGPIPMII